MSDGMDFWRWRAANPDASHFAAYQAGYEVARAECAKIAKVAWLTCPFGEIADADTMNDLCEYIAAAIQPLPAPPKEQG